MTLVRPRTVLEHAKKSEPLHGLCPSQHHDGVRTKKPVALSGRTSSRGCRKPRSGACRDRCFYGARSTGGPSTCWRQYATTANKAEKSRAAPRNPMTSPRRCRRAPRRSQGQAEAQGRQGVAGNDLVFCTESDALGRGQRPPLVPQHPPRPPASGRTATPREATATRRSIMSGQRSPHRAE